MSAKEEILTRLKEDFDLWEELLASMGEAQITGSPPAPGASIKEVVAHLRGWQQRSIARLEAAQLNLEPEFPKSPVELTVESKEDVDRMNAWFYEAARAQPWSKVQHDWREGFRRFLELGGAIPEKDLLEAGRYPWMEGQPLLLVLQASYEHHEEHLHPLLLAWLRQQRTTKTAG